MTSSCMRRITSYASVFILLHDHAGIVTAKTKSVAQRGIYNTLLRFVECEIESRVEFGIVGKMIDGRGDVVIQNTHDAGDGFDNAGSSEAVAGHGFC